ncbi:parathyroid hormone [Spea bombifrons]|uniref:parathyroid hormone n=1 Tax=Spea bombifrons TaxID=233779 RepID=UPI00234B41AF|nr:parathyroid hormone [Spea bombifrons]
MSFIADLTTIGMILCGVSFFTECEGKPIKRRAVSEVQLMHNYGDLTHFLQRQEWLQLQLQNLYLASVSTPQESTPKVAENRPQKPVKKENKTKHFAYPNQHTNQRKANRNNAKPNADFALKPVVP